MNEENNKNQRMQECYIDQIKIDKNYVRINVCDQESITVFKISPDVYFEKPYKIKEVLSNKQLDDLQHKHIYFYAYEKCIKKLASQDKTKKEIEDVLDEIKELSDEDKREIIQSLTVAAYINDESAAETQLYIDQNKYLGKKKTAATLLKRGVNADIIDELLSSVKKEDEIERGTFKAQKLFDKAKGKSQRERIQYVRFNLLNDGYEDIDAIIAKADLDKDGENEVSVLRQALQKAKNKYSRKYSGKELYYNIYKFLLSKGFESEEIRKEIGEEKDED